MTCHAALHAERFGFATPAPDPGRAPAPALIALAAPIARSVTRRFRAEPVPEGVLNAVLAAAQSAPSKSGLRQYSIVVLPDPAPVAAIASRIGTMPWIAQAPAFLLFCADIRRGRAIGERHGRAHANDNLDTLRNARADAALALGFAVVAAELAGLGTCPVSCVRNHLEKVAPLVGLPKGVFPVAGLALGWPEAKERVPPRPPPSGVIHRGRHSAEGEAEAIAAYDGRRPPAKPRYPQTHGAAPAGCAWSENVARQLRLPERAGFRARLRGRGFALD